MSVERRVAVGVDGGQSTIRLKVEDNTEVRTAMGVSHHVDRADAVVDRVVELLVPEHGRVRRLVAGLTTVPVDARHRAQMAAALRAGVGADEVWLTGDEVTAHIGAFSGASGVLLAAGTGVACLAVDSDAGVCRSFDGAGYLIGDEGGAYWLGRGGIRAVIASEEGRGPHTSLGVAIGERFEGIDDLGARLHALDQPVDSIAQAAVDVLEAAEQGDEVANRIVDDGVARLVRTVSAGVSAAGPGAPIAFDGRLLADGSTLAKRLAAAIAEQLPESRIEYHQGASLAGAMKLAGCNRELASWPEMAPYVARITTAGGCR